MSKRAAKAHRHSAATGTPADGGGAWISRPSHVLESDAQQDPNAAVVEVRLLHNTGERGAAAGGAAAAAVDNPKFISFQMGGDQSLELGAIVKQGDGVTLESAQGRGLCFLNHACLIFTYISYARLFTRSFFVVHCTALYCTVP